MFGKDSKKKDLIKNLENVYEKIRKEQQISASDFPDISKMQDMLSKYDFSKFHSHKPKLIEDVDQMLCEDIAKVKAMIPYDTSPSFMLEVNIPPTSNNINK